MVAGLSQDQRDRYARQLLLDTIGEDEQETLLNSRVLVLGAGGLGSSIIQYLTATGVGTLGIVDEGFVKRSNLQRQVIYSIDDVGMPKTECAARFIERLNPEVTVETYPVKFEANNAISIVSGYDVILDGLDNFLSRFLSNDVAFIREIPFVHGAIFGWEGQVSVFVPGGPCYRCLVPEAPPSGTFPSAEPIPVLPPVPGVIGALQSTETIKLLLGMDGVLNEVIIRYDGSDCTFETMRVYQNPDCPVCGQDGIDSNQGSDYSEGLSDQR